MNRSCAHSQTGTSLVEVLMAMTILVSFALPIMKFRAYILAGGPSGKELAHTVALSTMEDLGDQFYRSSAWPSYGEDDYPAGGHFFHRIWTLYPVGDDMGTGRTVLRRAKVTVTCNDCFGRNPTVEVVALLAKAPR